MARIIYAWELGDDYGHIGSFMPLALALREQGHEVIFVTKELNNAETVVSKYKFQVLQAPIWNEKDKSLPNPPLNYTEIILRFGFLNKTALSALNRVWLGLFALIKPDLIIADHSPVALFSARAVGLRRVVYGTGFCSPPHISPMPNMRYWNKVSQERLEKVDAHALAVMNSLLLDMQSKASPMQSVADLFKVNIDFLCTFPEMDHYPQRSHAQYWGPVFNTAHGREMHWQVEATQKTRKRIFLYLKPEYAAYKKVLASLKTLTDAQGELSAEVLIFSPNVPQTVTQQFAGEHLRFATEPIQLASILPECDLAICHGGHGTLAACLMAGVPLLLLPMHLEQFLASVRIKQLGAAKIVNLETKKAIDFDALIVQLLTESSYQQAAQTFAKRYAQFNPSAQFALMAEKINQLIHKTT